MLVLNRASPAVVMMMNDDVTFDYCNSGIVNTQYEIDGNPLYLASLLESYSPVRELRSSNKNLLTVPKLSLALSTKAFCVSAPAIWNSLS